MGFKDFLDAFSGYRQYKALGEKRPEIAFYSEMGTDRIYFEGIIRRLITDYDQRVLYLTSAKTDPLLNSPPEGLVPLYIGDGTFRTMLFLEIDVPLFVMTLPDLNTFQLKRSPNNVHYAYIFHSLVSTHMVYRHKAFDAYDTLFCVGPHHDREIREAERLFNLPEKQLVRHGYPRIDKVMADYRAYLQAALPKSADSPAHVLVAPSWGPTSIASTCASRVVENLLNAGFQVTFRPHPMTLRQDANNMDALQKQFGNNPAFAFDADIANARSLLEADLMICDWSGVALEFGLGMEKPVVFIDTPPKCNNSEFSRFEPVPVEVSIREELGAVIAPDNLERLSETIQQLLGHPGMKEHIAGLREAYIYNAGRADEIGARELIRLLEEMKTGRKLTAVSAGKA